MQAADIEGIRRFERCSSRSARTSGSRNSLQALRRDRSSKAETADIEATRGTMITWPSSRCSRSCSASRWGPPSPPGPALAPLTAALRDAGADGDLRVEAELAVALIVGIAVGRTHAALPALAVLKDDDLVSRLLPLLAPGPTT